MTTTRPTAKPKHSLIRSVLFVAALLLVGLVTRGYLRASSAPDSALATSGAFDAVAMLVIVAAAIALALLGKLRGKTRR